MDKKFSTKWINTIESFTSVVEHHPSRDDEGKLSLLLLRVFKTIECGQTGGSSTTTVMVSRRVDLVKILKSTFHRSKIYD